MSGLFDNFNPLFPISDPLTNKISEALPNSLRPIANPVGYALGKAVGPQTATKLIDPLDLHSAGKSGSQDMATILAMSEDEYKRQTDYGYG